MADQYERAHNAIEARYPYLWVRGQMRTLFVKNRLHDDSSGVPLAMWIRNRGTARAPCWRVDADLGSRVVIPVRFESHDVVDAVGVVLRCLVSSAREEGWTKVADELAAVERGPDRNL